MRSSFGNLTQPGLELVNKLSVSTETQIKGELYLQLLVQTVQSYLPLMQ